uniref:peptide chain release factor N(5)-glutamine methyltransferase n=1 Tax=Strigamia maritima TaxID=126957 RepID=T1J4Z6_STRMM
MGLNTLRNCVKLCTLNTFKSRNYCAGIESTQNVSSLIENWEKTFKRNNISEPDLSIRNIMVHVLDLSSIEELTSVSSRVLSTAQISNLEKFCRCRLSYMPIQYIIGGWQFIDLNVRLRPPVFIPRPETEEFVDIITKQIKAANLAAKILEVGCGSGVISLSILKDLAQIECTAIDQCKLACELTLQNAKLNDIDMKRMHVCQAKLTPDGISDINFERKFDFIVSNPPYISENLLPTLSPEVILYEDTQALDGGHDGLKVIKDIINLAPKLLQPYGRLFLETAPEHPEMIRDYLMKTRSKLHVVKVYRDFTKRNRFIEMINN